MNLNSTDCLITLIFYALVLGVGHSAFARAKTPGEFFFAGRRLPVWISAFAFLGVSVGVPEVIALGATGARFGLAAAALYVLGAIPVILFAAFFFLPLYYGSGSRTIPQFLSLRFDSKIRTLYALLFVFSTITASGLALALIARIIQSLHIFDGIFRAMDWPLQAIFVASAIVPALVVLGYVLLGGLRGAACNQALQLAVLVAGLFPVVLRGLNSIGGWAGLRASLPASALHSSSAGSAASFSSLLFALGLGIVLSAAFWCTDFRLLQIPMAATDAHAARRILLLAVFPRALLALFLIVPGVIAVSLPTPHTTTVTREENGAIFHEITIVRPEAEQGQGLIPAKISSATGKLFLDQNGHPQLDYDMATPSLIVHVSSNGLLGFAITALVAALLSSLSAGLVAFSAVFTTDLYQPLLHKDASPSRLLAIGRWSAVACTLLLVAAACAAFRSGSLFSALVFFVLFLNAPVFATFFIGAFSRRASANGAFAGLLAGLATALFHHCLTLFANADPGFAAVLPVHLHTYSSQINQAGGTVLAACAANFIVTFVVSRFTEPRPQSELAGLVYSLARKPKSRSRTKKSTR